MSYDIKWKGVNKRFTRNDFERYFSNRKNYQINASQAWYENEDTGVYFSFDYNDKTEEKKLDNSEYDFSFSVNLFRPHFFALEAANELSAISEQFQLTLEDQQIEDVKTFSAQNFVTAWNKSNESAYKSLLSESLEETFYVLPTDILQRIWQWNYQKNKLQQKYGDDVFVPVVSLGVSENHICSFSVWSDGISICVPNCIDQLILYKDDILQKKHKFFLRKKPEICAIEYSVAQKLIEQFKHFEGDVSYHLVNSGFPKISPEIKSFFLNTKSSNDISVLSLDTVLNEELYNKFTEQIISC